MVGQLVVGSSVAETPLLGDIIADSENVLQTVFVQTNETNLKNCLQLLNTLIKKKKNAPTDEEMSTNYKRGFLIN